MNSEWVWPAWVCLCEWNRDLVVSRRPKCKIVWKQTLAKRPTTNCFKVKCHSSLRNDVWCGKQKCQRARNVLICCLTNKINWSLHVYKRIITEWLKGEVQKWRSFDRLDRGWHSKLKVRIVISHFQIESFLTKKSIQAFQIDGRSLCLFILAFSSSSSSSSSWFKINHRFGLKFHSL